jgi:glycerol kinase
MFFNIRIDNGKRDMIRAVLEGICYHLRWLLECESKKVKTSDTIRFVGGGALSPVICQMLADITGRTIETVNNTQEAGAMGAAIVAAAGLLGGCWMSLELMGGFEKFCRFLPFYPAVRMSRAAFVLSAAEGGDFAVSLLTVLLWTALAATLAVLAFRRTMKGDRR